MAVKPADHCANDAEHNIEKQTLTRASNDIAGYEA